MGAEFEPITDDVQRYRLTRELYMLAQMRFYGIVAWHRMDMEGAVMRREKELIDRLGYAPPLNPEGQRRE